MLCMKEAAASGQLYGMPADHSIVYYRYQRAYAGAIFVPMNDFPRQ